MSFFAESADFFVSIQRMAMFLLLTANLGHPRLRLLALDIPTCASLQMRYNREYRDDIRNFGRDPEPNYQGLPLDRCSFLYSRGGSRQQLPGVDWRCIKDCALRRG